MTDGGRINTATATSGAGGEVNINTDTISISGQQLLVPAEEDFGLGNPFASGIITSTLGDATTCAGPCGNAGSISLTTGSLTMDDGAQLDSGTSSTGAGGSITVNASENISISGTLNDGTPGGIFSRTIGSDPGSGDGGNISITTEQNFSLSNGAAVSANSTGTGNSGTVTITADGNVQTDNGTISTSADQATGGDITVTSGQNFQLSNNSTISAQSAGPGDSGAVTLAATNGNFQSVNSTVSTSAQQGQGGDISVTAGQNFQLTNNSTVSAESSGAGDSGAVTLTATGGNFQSTNSTVSTSAQIAEGGDIDITAGQNVQLVNNTTISAESFGPGDAGDITVTSGNNLQVIDSTISTQAAQASGGNIKLTAPNNIQIINSDILSSVNGPPGSNGGNINIDPLFIIIQNSRILARAFEGRGGNITLTATQAIFIDDFSIINADSEFGASGTISVNSPTAVLAEVIAALPKNFVRLANLFGERCAAQKGGQFSSFTQGGPDGLPPAPGGFLPSPLMFSNPGAPLSSTLPSSSAAVFASRLSPLRLGLDPGQVDSELPSINLLPEFGCAAV